MPKVIFILYIKGTDGAIWKTIDYWMCQKEFLRTGEVSANLNLMWFSRFLFSTCPLRNSQSKMNDFQMVIFIFSSVNTFFKKLSKNQNCEFKLNFDT